MQNPQKQPIAEALLEIIEDHFGGKAFTAFIHFLNHPSGYSVGTKFYTGRDIFFYFPGLTQNDLDELCQRVIPQASIPIADRLAQDFYNLLNSGQVDFQALALSWKDGRHVSLDIVQAGWELNRQWEWDKFSSADQKLFFFCTGWSPMSAPKYDGYDIFEADATYYMQYGFYGDAKSAPQGLQLQFMQSVKAKMDTYKDSNPKRPFSDFVDYLTKRHEGARDIYFNYPGIALDTVMAICQSAGIPMIQADKVDMLLSWLVTLSNNGPGSLENPNDRTIFQELARYILFNQDVSMEDIGNILTQYKSLLWDPLTGDGQALLTWCLDPLDAKGTPPHYGEDGQPWGDREKLLPTNDSYEEFVHPTPGGGPESARLIVGQTTKTVYFTFDHYRSFLRVDPFMTCLQNPSDVLTNAQVVSILTGIKNSDANFNKDLQNLEKMTGIDLSTFNSSSFQLTPDQLMALTELMRNFQIEIAVSQETAASY